MTKHVSRTYRPGCFAGPEWFEDQLQSEPLHILKKSHPSSVCAYCGVPAQVIQADGSMLSCAFNAACTALVDAGIPMTQMLGE